MVTPPMHQTGRRYITGTNNAPIFTYASYGNFTFPAAISLKMNVEPVYESSGRVAKWWKHTFTIETVIDPTLTPESDTGGLYPVDLNMSQVRRWLSIPGQPLTFWNLGIGQNQRLDYSGKSPTGLSVDVDPAPFTNPSTGASLKQDPKGTILAIIPSSNHHSFYVDNLSDLNFGPRPQLLTCECIGGSRAYRIVWTVECALPNCCVEYTGTGFKLCDSPAHFNDGTYRLNTTNTALSKLKVTEFNYSLSWSIDENRFTTFQIVGSIEVAGTLFHSASDSTPSNFTGAVISSGDAVQALGNTFLLRPGFNRSMQYDIGRDKRRLEFRITDREIPSDNAYFPGIKECSVKHSVSGHPFQVKWNVTFDGEFEVQPGVPKYTGILALVSIISNRMQNVSMAISEMAGKNGKKYFTAFYLPSVFSFQEDIFSRKVSLNFSFEVFTMFDNLLSTTRLLTNTNESWLDHRNNLSPSILDHRGTAQIVTLSHEPLVTVCRSPDVFTDVARTWFKPAPGQQYSLFESQCPDFDKSILQIDYYTCLETYSSVIGQRPAKYVGSSFNVDKTPYYYDNKQSTIGLPDPQTQETQRIAVQGIHNSQIATKNAPPSSGSQQDPSYGYDMKMQSFGASENFLVLKAAVQTLCHDIRSLEVRQLKVDQNGQLKTIEPKCIYSSISHAVEDERAKVPKKTFFIENHYSIEGTPIGSAKIFINGVGANDTVQDILASTNPNKVNGSGSPPKNF